jgi:hypothetical protein
MCELAQGCSPLLLPLAARRCCCLELAAAAARRSAAAAEASALGAGAVVVGGCAQLRWSATGMRSISSALLLAKRLRAAALVGDRCGPFPRRCCLRSGCAQLRWSATGMRSISSALLLAKRLRAAALVGDRCGPFPRRSCAGRRPVLSVSSALNAPTGRIIYQFARDESYSEADLYSASMNDTVKKFIKNQAAMSTLYSSPTQGIRKRSCDALIVAGICWARVWQTRRFQMVPRNASFNL